LVSEIIIYLYKELSTLLMILLLTGFIIRIVWFIDNRNATKLYAIFGEWLMYWTICT